MKEKTIQSALRIASGNNELIVIPAKQSKQDEYLYAAFVNEKDYNSYILDGYDTEEYIIFKTHPTKFSFAWVVSTPGSYEEPPSSDFVEHKGSFPNLKAAVYALAEFIIKRSIDERRECLVEMLCEYESSLNFIDHD